MKGDALTIVTTSLNTQSNNLLKQADAFEKDAAALLDRAKRLLASAQDNRDAAAQINDAITTISSSSLAGVVNSEPPLPEPQITGV